MDAKLDTLHLLNSTIYTLEASNKPVVPLVPLVPLVPVVPRVPLVPLVPLVPVVPVGRKLN